MPRILLTVSVFAAVLLLPGMPATFASEAVAQAETSAAPAAAFEAAAQPTEPTAATGLPERSPQARTMRAYWHVFAAFAATWLLLFGYALSLGRRFGRLEEEVRRLQGERG
jgi:CcmD family protein